MKTKVYSRSYTKEQKQEYLRKLRAKWRESKALSENDDIGQALFRESDLRGVSYFSFFFVLQQMRSQGFDGIPYVDMKTFKKWRESGFIVRKGQQSTADGITWIGIGGDPDNDEDYDYVMPKVYKLFHRTQTDCPPIAA